jgi:hypothetical protein
MNSASGLEIHRKTEKERQSADRREGEGACVEPNHRYDSKKAWSSINHSIISGLLQEWESILSLIYESNGISMLYRGMFSCPKFRNSAILKGSRWQRIRIQSKNICLSSQKLSAKRCEKWYIKYLKGTFGLTGSTIIIQDLDPMI